MWGGCLSEGWAIGQGNFLVNGDVCVGLTALMCFPVGRMLPWRMKAWYLWHLAKSKAAQGYAKEQEERAERRSLWTIVLFLKQLEVKAVCICNSLHISYWGL